MSEPQELWLHELRPATWMAERLTALMFEFDEKFGEPGAQHNNGGVDYYLDGRIVLMHANEPVGELFPNDVEEWSYRQIFPGVTP